MRELPILFTGPMVRAILAGNKLQTRRMKALEYFSRPENDPDGWWCARISDGFAYMVYKQSPHERAVRCPYGQPGDRLWVRETWAFGIHAMAARRDDEGPFVYAADGTAQGRLGDRWRPSIHMPRSACRLVVEITGMREPPAKGSSSTTAAQPPQKTHSRACGAKSTDWHPGRRTPGYGSWNSGGSDKCPTFLRDLSAWARHRRISRCAAACSTRKYALF